MTWPQLVPNVKEKFLVTELMYSISGNIRAVVLCNIIPLLFFLRHCSAQILYIFICL